MQHCYAVKAFTIFELTDPKLAPQFTWQSSSTLGHFSDEISFDITTTCHKFSDVFISQARGYLRITD